jgi:hypothetical protein
MSQTLALSQWMIRCALKRLALVYCTQKRTRDFGVALLHSHFPVVNNETFLEEIDALREVITVRPVCNARPNVLPTSICFDDIAACSEEVKVVGLEYASKDTLEGVTPINELDCGILIRVERILRHLGKMRRFGLRLLHDPLRLNDRVVIETCDAINRVLTCTGQTDTDTGVFNSVGTVFCWRQTDAEKEFGEPVISQECMKFCKVISKCIIPPHGSHQNSTNHESTHDRV